MQNIYIVVSPIVDDRSHQFANTCLVVNVIARLADYFELPPCGRPLI